MRKKKNRLNIAEWIGEDKYSPYEDIIEALLENNISLLSKWFPFMTIDKLTFKGESVKILTVSFGSNVYDSVNDLEQALSSECRSAVIWTGETWT